MNIKRRVKDILSVSKDDQSKFEDFVKLAGEVEETLEVYKNRESLRLEHLQRAKAAHQVDKKRLSFEMVIKALAECGSDWSVVTCPLAVYLCLELARRTSEYEKALAYQERLKT